MVEDRLQDVERTRPATNGGDGGEDEQKKEKKEREASAYMSPKMIPNECSVRERRDHDECLFVVDDGRWLGEVGVDALADVGPLSPETVGFSIPSID